MVEDDQRDEVCDIERASDVLEGSSFSSPDVGVDAWLDLRQRVGDKQRLLWRAHLVSLHRGIDLSRHLFDRGHRPPDLREAGMRE